MKRLVLMKRLLPFTITLSLLLGFTLWSVERGAKAKVISAGAARPATSPLDPSNFNLPGAAQAVRDLYIVAHQDDDLLFMNPNIQNSIAAGNTVKVVYVTAGDACDVAEYWGERESGAKAAYALMAGVEIVEGVDPWTLTANPITEYTLTERPEISLVFFRLRAAKGEDGATCDPVPAGADPESLELLWKSTTPSLIKEVLADNPKAYTKQQLIDALAALINAFQPNLINTLDSSGLPFNCSPDDPNPDPSKCEVNYPYNQNKSYYYDHRDHYYSALFAREAQKLYTQPHVFRQYRGYSSALESENVTGSDLELKQLAFQAYAWWDKNIKHKDPPFGEFYQFWVPRQYLVNSVNSSPVVVCQNVTVAAGASCTTNASINNGSFDYDSGDTITITQSPAGPYPLGSTLVTLTVTDNHGASSSCQSTVTVLDTTKPVISCPANIITSLPLNSTATGKAVTFTVTAPDTCGSATVTTSHASGSVFPLGTTTVTATANDGRGNTRMCSFTVTVPYNFSGFFQPVDNLPTVNSVNAGQSIPVKFSLSGNKGLNIFAAGYPVSQQIACSGGAPTDDIEETVTAGASSLSYDTTTDQYKYVWKTDKAWKGTCRKLLLKFNDGSTREALFQFK